MIKLLTNLISSLSLIIIVSCSPVGFIGSAGTTTMILAEGERSLGNIVDDATIKLNLSQSFLKSENNLFVNVNTNIIEGRVLLTGIVDTQEIRIEAIKKTWEIQGVNEVVNEIQIGNKTGAKEYANDFWINTQVKALAAKTIGLRALSYNFETIKGKVYIAGLTSKKDQLDAVIESTKNVKGVKEIVNYVILVE